MSTWEHVVVGDVLDIHGARWTVTQVEPAKAGGDGALIQPCTLMSGTGEKRRGTPRADGEVTIISHLEPIAPGSKHRVPIEVDRLRADLDRLAMTTAAALVQLRCSATLLAEHLGDDRVVCPPAATMDEPTFRTHQLAYHGISKDTEGLDAHAVVWHDERLHGGQLAQRAPHTHEVTA